MATLAWRPQEHLTRFLPPNTLDQHPQQQVIFLQKRKRNSDELENSCGAGPSFTGPSYQTARVSSADFDDDEEEEQLLRKKKKAVTAKSPTIYSSSTELLNAMRNAFAVSQDVVFAGSYLDSNNPPMSDKQRVQVVTNDVWRATGYRFTVKDHPRTKEGHKTRLWCSQDEMRKHKPNAKARVSASGESLAKARYPCRSRLFISSREWNTIGQSLVTIRIHHHYSHEPYEGAVRVTAPATTWQDSLSNTQAYLPTTQSYSPSNSQPHSAYESYEPSSNRSSTTAVDSGAAVDWDSVSDNGPGPPAVDSDSEAEQDVPATCAPTLASTNVPLHSHPDPHVRNNGTPINLPPHSHPSLSAAPDTSILTPEIFQARMREHIRNLREFCNGLEYQVQFNDFRMLEQLENEGGSFLRFVHDCLRREGRLEIGQLQCDGQPTYMLSG
ncbi:hypothetical protein E1B28_011597 [Marasmius oreades]|uniref:Uncharacterized protein n=1 Tax=Marasmius oreades TaxID=181124 RepID=A0A9P7UPR5_9AGAR|nr:uncharacterized protein E1B28_011597 [Marasmius oreades]KAG7089972.1 hypothetical protein E1B28_011597 [Marasmius oreades]